MLISIIIPVYNTKLELIQECLDSTQLLNNLCDYEVIVVNDGSTNPNICLFLENLNSAPNHRHIIKIDKSNGGLSSARNTGIEHAKGKFIFPLDADDRVNPEIQHFIHYLIHHPDTDILYGNLSIFGDQDRYEVQRPFHKYDIWLFDKKPAACSIFSKKVWQHVGGYDETFITNEDRDFWCRCALINAKFTYIPYANYDYRIINDGESLFQKTRHLLPECHQRIWQKIPLEQFDYWELDKYFWELKQTIRSEIQSENGHIHPQNIYQRLHQKPRLAFYLFLYAYFPKFYDWLYKKKYVRYHKDNFFGLH